MSIELVDKIDQANKADANVGGIVPKKNKRYKKIGLNDLLLVEEDEGKQVDGSKQSKSNVMKDETDYIGLELESVLQHRSRNRRLLFLSVMVFLLSLGIASTVARNRQPDTPSNSKSSGKKNKNKSSSSSAGNDDDATDDNMTDDATDVDTVIGAWPTAAPLPKYDICPPNPIFRKHHKVIHLTDVTIVPEAQKDDTWEYTFSDLDISDDASIIAVGLSDFGADSDYAVGLVRVFAHACNKHMRRGSWKQLGQDLIGYQDSDGFGSAISSSKDGTVMAIAATQDDVDNANGYVQVYYLDSDDNSSRPTWKKLGQRLEDLEDTYEYWNLGSAIDLSDNGETLAILGILSTNKFVTRVFDYDYNELKWTRKGHDLTVKVETKDDTEWWIFHPRITLNEDGTKLNVVDPKFGLMEYNFKFETDKWVKGEALVSSSLDNDEVYIESLAFDEAASVLAFSAYDFNDEDSTTVVAKLVDFDYYNKSGDDANEAIFFNISYPDIGVGISVDVSSDGGVAAVVAYKASIDDEYDWDYDDIGSLTVFSKDNKGRWKTLGKGTDEEGLAVPGSLVTLSRDGSIAAIGTDTVIALYGINLNHDPINVTTASTTAPTAIPASTEGLSTFELCAPFPHATQHDAGQIVDLPIPISEDENESIPIGISANGSIVAVGIVMGQRNETDDDYPVETPGMVRVYGYSCATNNYTQMGQDLYGEHALDGFGMSLDLSDDGATLVVGANQPAPGKSGYVNIYSLQQQQSGGGTTTQEWILDHQVTTVNDGIKDDELVQDLGREVQISADATTVAIHGSFVDTNDYGYLSSFIRILELSQKQKWVKKGSDLHSSIIYDEYGTNVKLAFSADGQTLGVVGSYNSFSTKLYSYDNSKKNWTETVLPPFQRIQTDDDGDGDYDWDDMCSEYFDGTDISLNADGTAMAIAGTQWSNNEAIVRLLTRPSLDNSSSSAWTLSNDPLDFIDDYAIYSMDLSADASVLSVGSVLNSDTDQEQGGMYVLQADQSDSGWKELGTIEGYSDEDMLGARVRTSSDGTIAVASSKHGYISFFKI